MKKMSIRYARTISPPATPNNERRSPSVESPADEKAALVLELDALPVAAAVAVEDADVDDGTGAT